jgi:putative ABC transport system permease protein
VLSIVERTREIGALRAMGMTRRQLKRMIRIESQITALIGMIVIAFFAGRPASRWPARRAAHLNPLQALQYE